MHRSSPSLIVLLAFVLAGSLLLSACPARRGGSPADINPTLLDRA